MSDGAGGAVVAWMRTKNGGAGPAAPYAQRISGSGTEQWTANGVLLDTSTAGDFLSNIVSDGSGGAIVAWAQNLSAIRAQHIDLSGTVEWISGGLPFALHRARKCICRWPVMERVTLSSPGRIGAMSSLFIRQIFMHSGLTAAAHS